MQNASIERLSKLITDQLPEEDGSGKNRRWQPRKPVIHLHIGLAEGWFSLFLLATVVYSTVWSVQAAGWVENLNILTLTTALGLLIGVLAAKQRRLPRLLSHPLAVLFGMLLAFWQTAGADYGGNTKALVAGLHQWVGLALNGGTSSDDSIFLLLITALGFLLAYTSAWLVYRTRHPWLMIIANAAVLLINLNNIDPAYIIFLVVFLVAALLLLLRFNLYESAVRWKRQGLRCADDLGWEFMQAGALISIGILILAWLLPWGYTNNTAEQIWSADNNPWVQIQDAWNRLISVSGGYNQLNHGSFADTLVLGGNPNLSNEIVFTVTASDGQYLESLSYDTYTGRGWTNSPTTGAAYKPNSTYPIGATDLRPVTQTVSVVNPPGEQYPYLLGAPEIASVDQAAQVLIRKDGTVLAWLRSNGKLAAGNKYTLVSFASAADVKTLQSVPLPAEAPSWTPDPAHPDAAPPVTYYDPNILRTYLQLPKGLDPNILILAKQITAPYKTMYDKAVALETYLRNNYKYDTNISLPAGEEGVSWFLFRSQNRGFCNYFATAMAVMARELGMPARVVAGYTSGKYDTQHHDWVIRGSDAHAWTQIYFAGYGWINFEPSATFSSFVRPLPNTSGITSGSTGGSGTPVTGKGNHLRLPDETGSGDSGLSGNQAQAQAQLRQDIGLALFSIVLLILAGVVFFGMWWRRLFKGYGLAAQVFGRLCVLASWAGISIQRSQTPYEYIQALSEVAPDQAVTLERLGDIYVRDRWADPNSPEHPGRTGEVNELPALWKRLQPGFIVYVLRHPHFLRLLLEHIGGFISKRRSRQRKREALSEELVDID